MTGSGEDKPIVSVVVPTRNRADLLLRLGAALSAQKGVGSFEIVFVDDCSTDETPQVLAQVQARASVPVQVLRTSSSSGNPARPRNLGWRAAQAPLVAFVDDDCRPRTDWVAALVDALGDADAVQGLTDADPDEAPGSGPFARFIVVTEFSWKFETCNIAYRRELLERLGGFDEGFPLKFGEDVDLGWRAVDAGARFAWSPEAVVYHRVEMSGSRVRDWRNWIRYSRHCELAALTVRKHPRLRDHLYRRYFYKPYHAPTALALLGIVLVPRSPRSTAVLALPWLVYRTAIVPRAAPRKWLWAVLPMGFVVDAAEVAATVRGAIKYRTPII
jgi:GT2 family glycosyltransferase